MSTIRTRWHHLTKWGRAHVCWATLMVVGFAVVLLGAAMSDQPEGTCSGIGFGCQLSGPDLALIIAIFLGPVVLAVELAGHLLIAVAGAVARRADRTPVRSAERDRS